MLHRTRALQAEKTYNSFLEKYKDFSSICSAGSEKIISELKGLGLQWRAKNFHNMACEIKNNYNGILPKDKKDLLKLPGIGPYIASAILCFAYELPEPMLDTNTVRVIGRVFGLKITDSSRRSKKFENIMQEMVNIGQPKYFSLSLIDFAEAICKSGAPLCFKCPINGICCYYKYFMQ